ALSRKDEESFFVTRVEVREVRHVGEVFAIAIHDQVREAARVHGRARGVDAPHELARGRNLRARSSFELRPVDVDESMSGSCHVRSNLKRRSMKRIVSAFLSRSRDLACEYGSLAWRCDAGRKVWRRPARW